MQYFGGKSRISKQLSQYLNSQLKDGQPFVDLFCGSCNIITKIDDNRQRIANDKHKYLIAMWKELQNGWIPPKNITKEEYINIKNNKDAEPQLSGFVGFGSSFGGKWFGGYVKYRGKSYDYCLSAYNSVLKKLKNLKNVTFYNLNYDEVKISRGALVYCDIPYRNTTQYCKAEVGVFNHNEFYQWVRDNSDKYDIYISEYKKNVPNDFEIVWEMESRQSLRNKDNKKIETTEVLMKYKNTQ